MVILPGAVVSSAVDRRDGGTYETEGDSVAEIAAGRFS
jgi:hypothetical protein